MQFGRTIADAVAGPKTEAEQRVRDPVGARVQLGVREPFVPVDERELARAIVRMAGGQSLETQFSAPPDDARRPGVAGAGREEQHELAVPELALARRAVERQQRVDAAHVSGVVEVGRARLGHPELTDEHAVHRGLHVDAADVVDVREGRTAPLERSAARRRRNSQG